MTNLIAIAWLSWQTNIIHPEGDGPRGYRWLQTNVLSAVIVVPVPGAGIVTSTVPVVTNVTTVYNPAIARLPRYLTKEEADAKGLPVLTKK